MPDFGGFEGTQQDSGPQYRDLIIPALYTLNNVPKTLKLISQNHRKRTATEIAM